MSELKNFEKYFTFSVKAEYNKYVRRNKKWQK